MAQTIALTCSNGKVNGAKYSPNKLKKKKVPLQRKTDNGQRTYTFPCQWIFLDRFVQHHATPFDTLLTLFYVVCFVCLHLSLCILCVLCAAIAIVSPRYHQFPMCNTNGGCLPNSTTSHRPWDHGTPLKNALNHQEIQAYSMGLEICDVTIALACHPKTKQISSFLLHLPTFVFASLFSPILSKRNKKYTKGKKRPKWIGGYIIITYFILVLTGPLIDHRHIFVWVKSTSHVGFCG